MTPNPLIYIYSGLLSRFVLLVKVLGSLLILLGVVWSYHACGLWDLSYGRAKVASGQEFLAFAHYNPLSRLEAWVRGTASAWQQCQKIATQLPLTLPAGDLHAERLRLLWQWLSAPQPLTANPYPSLRTARVQHQWQLAQVLGWYYLSTHLGALVCGVGGSLVWMAIALSTRTRRPRLRAGVPQLAAADLVRQPSTVSVPRTGFLSLGLPREVLRLAAQCQTAREVLRILSAHRQWPASLSHHGAQAGGLVATAVKILALRNLL